MAFLSSVGKTSLSIQYVDKHFVPQSKATIAAAFHTKSLQINGVRVDLQIWDTAGQEKVWLKCIPASMMTCWMLTILRWGLVSFVDSHVLSRMCSCPDCL